MKITWLKFNNKVSRWFSVTILTVVFAVVIVLVAPVAMAEWNEPSSAPVTETFSEPLTTGPENQAKAGNLEISPSYDLTSSSSFVSDPPKKPLDVRGNGAIFSTPYVYNDVLAVANYTLYANSIQGWVGIGAQFPTANTALKVEGGPVRVGSAATPINGRAVSGVSSSGAGITAATGNYNYGRGISAVSGSNTAPAVSGTSTIANSLKGESTGGYGIFAQSESQNSAAVYGQNTSSGWAGYFKGFFGSGADVVARQFLARGLNNSKVPYTSGQEVATVNSFGTWTVGGNSYARMAFDGTYVWVATARNSAADNKNLFQFRASDGVLIKSYLISSNLNIPKAITYDGKYIWIVQENGDAVRFNPADGTNFVVDLLAGFNYSGMAVSAEGDQRYVWVTEDDNGGIYDGVYKINADTLTYTLYSFHSSANSAVNLGLTGVNDPYSNSIVYDGQYIWIITASGHLVRLWAQNPADTTNIPLTYSTSSQGVYRSIVYDGQYLWLGCSSTALPILRVWAPDPDDTQHPRTLIYPPTGTALPVMLKTMAFDGTYVWAMNHDNATLYRYLAADPMQRVTFTTTVGAPSAGTENMIFDGTFLWIAQFGGPPTLHKIFTGTGFGQADLSRTVQLDPLSAQSGNVSISGNGQVGGNITAGADLQAPANQWGGADESSSITGGQASCASGKFMTGLVLDSSSIPTSIICNGL